MTGSRARGGMFMAAFGTMWLVGGVLGEFPSMPWLAAIAVAAGAALFLIHWRALRAEPPAPPAEDPAETQRTERHFRWVNIGQWAAFAAAVVGLNVVHRTQWIVPAGVAIVGLHFLPLASLFRNRAHYLTGAAMVALAVVLPWRWPIAAAIPLLCLGAGAVLWLSALNAVRAARA
ncbi:hypothetical protein J5226_01485 [Lysobacter sp. K5869]|uniref:hypothetical protein n=1 Tax=Lysobacter sp. K5869 TaxID=2820808 RepID=UPI001C05F629|nr:hypothetical protein [Lysobacter sp. K5869]QWP77107.1 hypothetical protein J5226_01485 [Lysobacter sp. K5869]